MAHVSAADGSVPSLADMLGVSVEPKMSFERAVNISKGLKGGVKKLARPVVRDLPLGQTKVLDLPLIPIEPNVTKTVKHLIDIITCVPKDHDWQAISSYMLQNKIDRLPTPFAPKSPAPVPFHTQLVLVEGQCQDDATSLLLLKEFVFEAPHKVELIMPLVHGQAHRVNSGGNQRGGPKAFQYMLDKLGGRQVRCYAFDDGPEDSLMEEQVVDDAYDFILGKAPRQEGTNLTKAVG